MGLKMRLFTLSPSVTLRPPQSVSEQSRRAAKLTAVSADANDCICLTDTARYRSDESNAAIGNRLCNRNTIEYLGI